MTDALVWIDCEMTGLDATSDVLVEIAVIVTSSGLLEEIAAATTTVEQAEDQVLDYIKRFAPERRKAPLCGNTISTDRSFIVAFMPRLDDHLHYRMIDVSTIKELARRWYPRAYYNSPPKDGGHRALADIVESINELRYYRATVLVPAPGPDSDAAKAAAAALKPEADSTPSA
jgi:oligoribonuclease